MNTKKISWDEFKNLEDKRFLYVFSQDACDECKKWEEKFGEEFNDSLASIVKTTFIEVYEFQYEEIQQIIPLFKGVPFTCWYSYNTLYDGINGSMPDDMLQSFILRGLRNAANYER